MVVVDVSTVTTLVDATQQINGLPNAGSAIRQTMTPVK